MSEKQDILANRLCLASDAILDAMHNLQTMFPDGVPFAPRVLRAMPSCPEALLEFTPEELDRATAFLLRLGILTHA